MFYEKSLIKISSSFVGLGLPYLSLAHIKCSKIILELSVVSPPIRLML